ncbi:MAG: PHP domain-containing protein [Sandaracinaceae bacterium]|nr:PHP domain-containing protein [Sandaracinaceae bacterium]
MLRAAALALCLVACGGEGDPDAGRDAAAATDVELTATPDPAELTECLTAPPPEGVARAKHVTCADELVEGALAMGRVGDIVIENARARFVVRVGDGAASTIGAPAGGLVDAALRDGPDLLKELFPLFDLVSMGPTAIEVVDAGGDDEARVRVLFSDAPIGLVETVLPDVGRAVRLRGQLDYVLRADEDALRVTISVTTEAGLGRSGAALGVIALLGGGEHFEPGVGVLDDDHLGGPGGAVIVERPEGALAVAVAGEEVGVTHIETIQMIRGPRATLVQGALTTIEARVAVGETAAAAAAGALEGEPTTLTGVAGERVLVALADGTPWLRSRFGASRQITFPAPTGAALTMTPGFGPFFEAPSAPLAATLSAAPAGALVIAATVDGVAGVPVRATVERAGLEVARVAALGERTIPLPPGDYRVTISHGLEHDAATMDVTLGDGDAVRLEPDLVRAIDTDGWVSVDLHLHSDLSTDSVHPVEDAVRLLAAEGVQAAAATDHDYVTDYARIGALAGVDLALVSGVEVSTTTFGHINGYPLLPRPDRSGAGAPAWFDMTPADVFGALREAGDPARGGALVQINHPRLGDASFFGARRLDREMGTLLEPEDLGFEVLEVWNGYTRGGNEDSFLDWLALLAAGRRFTMVGNSDSHVPDRPPGSPRSFVRVADEGDWDWSELRRGLAAGEVTVAAGVFVTAELAGPAAGSVPVHVRVQAPPWARVDRLRVYAGREATVDQPIVESSDPVRFDGIVDVPLDGAGFVVVRADGPAAPAPIQHFEPVGVTNPLFLP